MIMSNAANLIDRATKSISDLILWRRPSRQSQSANALVEYQALTNAVRNKDTPAVKDLLAWGVSPNPHQLPAPSTCGTASEELTTPLTYAIEAGSTRICCLLIKAGAIVSRDHIRQAIDYRGAFPLVRYLLASKEKWNLELPLKDLQVLAAVNPFRWADITQDELDERIERASLGQLKCRPTVPGNGPFGNRGNGKTVVTRAVLERLAVDEPDLFKELFGIHQSASERDQERLVFERIDQMVAERTREALNAIASQRSTDEVARRAM